MSQTYNIDAESDSVVHLAAPSFRIYEDMLYVQDIGFFVAREKFHMRRPSLESFLIHYTIEGEGYLEYQNQEVFMGSGTVMWIDCSYPHFYKTSSRVQTWKTTWVHFSGANCRYYYEQFLSANNGKNVAQIILNNHISDLINQIIQLYQNFECSMNTDIRISALLASVMSECIVNINHSDVYIPIYVRKAQKYIQEHCLEPITLDSLAEHLFISKYYLQRLFSQYMLISPKEYISRLRINHAKVLLRKTDLPIQKIAFSVGYNNVSHFIELFKRLEGETPGVYRNNWGRFI